MITLARSVSKSLSVLASLPAPPFRTLTDTMSTRFLVPALISGMILTVRTVSPTLVCSSFMCFPRVLVIPFGPSTRHEQSLILFYKRILTFCSAQDMQCVENCDDPDPRRHVLYEQPVWQTLQMFRMSPLFPCPRHISEPGFYLLVGEMLCAFLFLSLPPLSQTKLGCVRLSPDALRVPIEALACYVHSATRRGL